MAAEYNIEKELHIATRSLSESLTLQLEQGHANLATKTNELSEEKEKHAIARNELVKEKENLVKLTDDLNEAREKNHDIIKQLDTEKALSNSENSELKLNLKDMAMTLSEKQTSVKRFQEENETLVAKVDQLSKNLEAEMSEKIFLKSSLEEKQAMLDEITIKNQNNEQEVLVSQEAIENAKHNLNDEKEKYDAIIKQLNTEKASSCSENAELKINLKDLATSLSEKMTSVKKFQDENQTFVGKFNELKKKLENETSEKVSLESSLKEKQVMLDKLTVQNQNLAQKVSESQQVIEKGKEDMGMNDNFWQEKLQNSIQSQKTEYELQLNKVTNSLREKEQILDNMKAQSSTLENEILQANEAIEKTRIDVAERISDEKDKSWQEKLKVELQNQKETYENQVKNIDNFLTEKQTIVDEANLRIKNLESGLSEAKEALEKTKDEEGTRIAAQKDQYWQEKVQEELLAQKKRYEAKVKNIHDQLTSKYKDKLEECIKKWQADVEEKEKKFAREALEQEKKCENLKGNATKYEDRYDVAKRKIEEVVSRLDEVTTECSKKDTEVNQLKKSNTLLEVQLADFQSKPSTDNLSLENQHLQQEIKKLRSQSRSLQVQCDAADMKIRELQKPAGSSKSTSSLPPVKPRKSPKLSESSNTGFKMPAAMNTPGRTRATRTQSEVTMARRPPQGSGSIFMMDEEAGEMFSNSYLSDLKAGRCTIGDNAGRISELARRNTMQPAHLKSTYPAETQFRPEVEFTDDALRHGNIQKLTDTTSNLSLDSPSLNTRRQSSIRMNISSRKSLRAQSSPPPVVDDIVWKNTAKKETKPIAAEAKPKTPPKPLKPIAFEISPAVPKGVRGPRKRQSMTTADVENTTAELPKRTRKELSYSKPGPPTPARRHNRSNNSSLNTSAKSLASLNQSILTTGSNVSFDIVVVVSYIFFYSIMFLLC